jgi:DNA polymerase epsilon subunit 1
MFTLRTENPHSITVELRTPEIEVLDIEDTLGSSDKKKPVLITSRSKSSNDENSAPSNGTITKRKRSEISTAEESLPKYNWREVLGPAPKLAEAGVKEWLKFQKRKWKLQLEFRQEVKMSRVDSRNKVSQSVGNISRTLTNFVQKTANTKIQKPWQILRILEQANSIGVFKMWVLVECDLFAIQLKVNRTFMVNQYKPLEKESNMCRKTNKHLPRCQTVHNLYEYSIPEDFFQKHNVEILDEFANPNVEGIYELNIPLMFSLLMKLGCVCGIKKNGKNGVKVLFLFNYSINI